MQSHHFLQSAADPQLGMIGSDQETRAEENQVKRQEFNKICIFFSFLNVFISSLRWTMLTASVA